MMLHLVGAARLARAQSLSSKSSIVGRRPCRGALAVGCACVAAIALLTDAHANGCNSGNVPDDNLLTSAPCQANASGANALAIGPDAQALGSDSVAIGGASRALGEASVAVGDQAQARGANATAVGFGAGDLTGAIEGVTAVGVRAGLRGMGVYSVAIGAGDHPDFSPRSPGDYSVAIGSGREGVATGASSNHTFGIAVGAGSVAQGVRSTAVGAFAGDNAGAGNHRNSAFGTEAGRFVNGAGNTAAGLAAGHTVAGDVNAALGNSAGQAVTGNRNLAAGVLAGVTVNGSSNVAVGDNAGRDVIGGSNIGIGTNAGRNINAAHTVAIGTNARATAHNAVAIGRGTTANQGRAVALGYGSIANVADTVSVGSDSLKRRIVNVAKGVQPNDTVNVAQLQAAFAAATDAPSAAGRDSTVSRELAALRSLVGRLEALLAQQQQRIAELENGAAAGR
jgi:autotransporter adhesin